MTVVGRAYVTVRAVTRQVEGDIEKGVDKALDRVEAKAEARGKEAGEKHGKGFGDGVANSGVDKQIEKAVSRYDADSQGRDVGTKLGDAIGHSLFDDSALERRIKALGSKISDAFEPEGEKSGKSFLAGFASTIGKGAISPAGLIGAAAPSVITQGLTGVSDLLASTTALASTLGPTVAASAAVGGSAMAGLLTTIGAVTLAFKTQSNALSGLKADLGEVRDFWQETGKGLQDTLFPALESSAQRITASLGPEIRQGLNLTARSIGEVTGQLAGLTERPAFQARFATIMNSNADALERFGSAGVHGVSSLVSLAAAASPLTTRFSIYINQLSTVAARHLAAAEASGKLERQFSHAGDTTAEWGRIIGNTGGALKNIFGEALPEGNNLLDMLGNVTAKFNSFTDSTKGRNEIREWFEKATPVTQAFGDVLGATGKALGSLSGDGDALINTLEVLADDAIPALADVLNALSGGSSELLGAILPPIGALAHGLAPAIGDTAEVIGKELGPALDDLVPPLVEIGDAALDVVRDLGPFVGLVGDLAGIAADTLAPALTTVADGLDALPGPMRNIVVDIVALKIAFSFFKRTDMFDGMRTGIRDLKFDMSSVQGASAKMKVGLSSVTSLLGGGWTLALGAGISILGLYAQKQAETKQQIDEVRDTLDKQTGAITTNTRQWVVKKLSDDGTLDAAKNLGLNLNDVTDAILGQGDAAEQVGGQLAAMRAASAAGVTGPGGIAEVQAQADAINKVGQAIGGTSDKITAAQHKAALEAEANAKAYDHSTTSASQRSKVEGQLGGVIDRTTTKTKKQADATDDLTRATYRYRDATAKIIQGNIGLEQAIDDAAKTMKKTKDTLDINSQAGRDNMNAFLGIADAASKVTGSAEHQQKALKRAHDQIRDMADNMNGVSTPAAKRLADRLIGLSKAADKVPNVVHTKIELDDGKARRDLLNYSAAFDGLDGRVAKTHVSLTAAHMDARLERGRAGGGWITGPGTTTSDSILYGRTPVSNQEFVVNAASAEANRQLVETINNSGGRKVEPAPIRAASKGNLSVTINNPIAEPASVSLGTSVKRVADDHGWSE